MQKIKFSHDYEKLPAGWIGTHALLIGVQYIENMQKFKINYSGLIEKDTKFRGEAGSYDLNFNEGLLLAFYHIGTGLLFTTIRRFSPDKSDYYQDCEMEVFELVYIGASEIV